MAIPEMKSNTGGGIVKEKLDNMGRMGIIEENIQIIGIILVNILLLVR